MPRRRMVKGLAVGGFAAALGPPMSSSVARAATASSPVDALTRAGAGGGPYPASDPTNAGGWTLDPVFSDEFTGRALDAAKWYDHITYWEGRAPSYFDPANVGLDRGRAVIPFRNLNKVANPSFEDGVASWEVSAGGVEIVYEGTVAPMTARLAAGAWARQTVTGLHPHTTYRLSAYGKIPAGAEGVVRVSGYDGDSAQDLSLTSASFAPAGLTFVTGRDAMSATVTLLNPGASGSIDVTMVAVIDARDDAPLGSFFSTGAIQSRTMAHYGYYEVRAKVADSSSTSSFWFQGSESEIDVIEAIGNSTLDPGYGSMMPMNLHYFPGGWANDQAFPMQYDTGVRLADGFHVFGLDWQPESIRFYFDGTLVRTQDNLYWHEPEYLFLDSEAFLWFGFPPPGTLPSEYQIDYVRAWK